MPRFRLSEWIALAVFETLAAYVAVEPMLASSGDCIDALEIFVFLPYYALLYFGTLPAIVGIGIWRTAANRSLDFMPTAVLLFWAARIWRSSTSCC